MTTRPTPERKGFMGRPEPLTSRYHCRGSSVLVRTARGVGSSRKARAVALFVDRAETSHFATSENGNRPQAVIMLRDILELDMRDPQTITPGAPRSTPARISRLQVRPDTAAILFDRSAWRQIMTQFSPACTHQRIIRPLIQLPAMFPTSPTHRRTL